MLQNPSITDTFSRQNVFREGQVPRVERLNQITPIYLIIKLNKGIKGGCISIQIDFLFTFFKIQIYKVTY